MKMQKGFTLIELVLVIVILGVLAATAVPKFMDLQRDARISAMQGLMAALKSASNMIYSKAVLKGVEHAPTASIPFNGVNISTSYGYPTWDNFMHDQDNESDVFNFIMDGSEDWITRVSSLDGQYTEYSAVIFTKKGDTHDVEDVSHCNITQNNCPGICGVIYIQPSQDNTPPQFLLVTEGC